MHSYMSTITQPTQKARKPRPQRFTYLTFVVDGRVDEIDWTHIRRYDIRVIVRIPMNTRRYRFIVEAWQPLSNRQWNMMLELIKQPQWAISEINVSRTSHNGTPYHTYRINNVALFNAKLYIETPSNVFFEFGTAREPGAFSETTGKPRRHMNKEICELLTRNYRSRFTNEEIASSARAPYGFAPPAALTARAYPVEDGVARQLVQVSMTNPLDEAKRFLVKKKTTADLWMWCTALYGETWDRFHMDNMGIENVQLLLHRDYLRHGSGDAAGVLVRRYHAMDPLSYCLPYILAYVASNGQLDKESVLRQRSAAILADVEPLFRAMHDDGVHRLEHAHLFGRYECTPGAVDAQVALDLKWSNEVTDMLRPRDVALIDMFYKFRDQCRTLLPRDSRTKNYTKKLGSGVSPPYTDYKIEKFLKIKN